MTAARPFHHQRPLAAAAAAYGLGVWAGASFAWRPALCGVGIACGIGIALLLPALGRKRIAGVLAAVLFLGMLLGGCAANPALPEPGRYQVTGVLSADSVLREDGTAAAYLSDVRLENERGETALSSLYWTYTPDAEAPFLPKEGDRVRFEGYVYLPSGQVNPYGFDFRMYLLQKGIPAGVSGAVLAETLDHPGRGAGSLLYQVRQGLLRRARLVFGADSALPEALLLGDRSNLPEETRQDFADAGAAHLLAVSGLHVGLIAALVLILLRRWLHPKGQLAAMALFLLLYSALLSFPAPVVRASLLLLIFLLRRILRKAPDPLTALCAAFFAILLVRPLDLFSPSFQLSFCAVLGMVLFAPVLERKLQRERRPRFLRKGWVNTFSATAGTVLPTVQLYHLFSLAGLLFNPFLCAFFAVLLPLYALTLLMGCVYLPAGVWLAGWVNPVTRGLTQAVSWMGSLPLASVRLPSLPWYCVLAAAAVLILATRFCLFSRRRKALLAVGLLTVSIGTWRLTLCRNVQYIQLAVGQADAALILDGQETVLIDAGEYGGDVASYLLSTGRQADRVILTHLHRDHCMGLIQLLEEEIPIGAVYLPEGAEKMQVDEACLDLITTLREKEIPVLSVHAGDVIATNRTSLTVTWPWADTTIPGQDANRFSLGLLCDLDGVLLLSASDIPGEYERYAARDADILKVSHHGSKTSTGDAFLEAVSPRFALITNSPVSSRLPHADTLARLEACGAQAFDTASSGALTITVRAGEFVLTPYLNQKEQP
ncbi:MAG: DNA internalization-related competence protein ComEC/Rec2 [Clostridia bacterium]|nr:DNA internalization-related competence protein ComEC/Rec2 [Clostridia bacterium]